MYDELISITVKAVDSHTGKPMNATVTTKMDGCGPIDLWNLYQGVRDDLIHTEGVGHGLRFQKQNPEKKRKKPNPKTK